MDIIEVKGEVLREGGSVVFCLEELLGRSSALCWVTRGRYGRRGGEGGNKRKRKWMRGGGRGGEGLRGKAYLVVGVIPGEFFLFLLFFGCVLFCHGNGNVDADKFTECKIS